MSEVSSKVMEHHRTCPTCGQDYETPLKDYVDCPDCRSVHEMERHAFRDRAGRTIVLNIQACEHSPSIKWGDKPASSCGSCNGTGRVVHVVGTSDCPPEQIVVRIGVHDVPLDRVIELAEAEWGEPEPQRSAGEPPRYGYRITPAGQVYALRWQGDQITGSIAVAGYNGKRHHAAVLKKIKSGELDPEKSHPWGESAEIDGDTPNAREWARAQQWEELEPRLMKEVLQGCEKDDSDRPKTRPC